MKRITTDAQFSVSTPGVAADGTSAVGMPRFELVGYTGRAIRQSWSRNPLVVDLAGMDTTSHSVAVMYGHQYDLEAAIGQADRVDNSGQDLVLAGDVIGEGPLVDKVMAYAKKGWKFQASIGADVNRIENVAPGETVTVNGREFTGPISVVRSSTLRETSVVLFGADNFTSAAIAAEASEDVLMADHANETPDVDHPVVAEGTASVAVGNENVTVTADKPEVSVDEIKKTLMAELKAELLADIRASRPAAPAIHVVAKPANDAKVVEAALCMAGGLSGVEQKYDERTLEAAHSRRNEVSLSQVVLAAARANGYKDAGHRITESNCRDVLRAAFVQAAYATHSISTILSATYGKFLLDGFTAVEQNWDAIASTRNVSDYKSVTGVRLTGGFEFEEVANDGELRSADAGEESRTIKAKLYGRLSSISMVDLVNDDLGALTQVSSRLGYGAAIGLNKAFWTEFEASNATYFAKETAAGGNAFSMTSLKTAATGFRKLKNPDNNPLGVPPSVLLVPAELEVAAAEAMSSSLLITGSDTVRGNANVFAGRYRVVPSSYLSSATTWWLAADPRAVPAMEVAFLNGQRQPMVESADADFNTLGIQVRGHWSWGVAKAEKNGCYRMATA
jgi:hypothetical protein